VATVQWLDGFEHGNTGVPSSFSGTPAFVTTPVRTGLRSLEITAAGASEGVQYSSLTSNFTTTAFYLRFAALPGATVKIVRMLNANGNGYMRCSSAGQLSVIVGAGAAVNVGSPLSINTWYRIVIQLDSSTGTASIKASVNGGTDATATNVQVSANTTAVQLGPDDAVTVTFYADDWLIATASADYAEIKGWTSHSVQSLIPSADGTHNITTAGDFDSFVGTAFDNTTTTGFSFIDHRPLQMANTADNVIRQELGTTANYMELTLENLAAGDSTVSNVRCYGAHVESATTGASLGEMRLLLSDNTEVLTTGSISMIDSTEDPGITVTLRKRMAIAPGGEWDTTKVNGLKIRLGFGDNNPDVNFIDCMVEVLLYTPAAASVVQFIMTNAYRVGHDGFVQEIQNRGDDPRFGPGGFDTRNMLSRIYQITVAGQLFQQAIDATSTFTADLVTQVSQAIVAFINMAKRGMQNLPWAQSATSFSVSKLNETKRTDWPTDWWTVPRVRDPIVLDAASTFIAALEATKRLLMTIAATSVFTPTLATVMILKRTMAATSSFLASLATLFIPASLPGVGMIMVRMRRVLNRNKDNKLGG
jgi:hypothetical protein